MGYCDSSVTITRAEYQELKRSDAFFQSVLAAAGLPNRGGEIPPDTTVKEFVKGNAPVLRLGPGGEFVRDYY
jgi:hypothetical protein